MATVDVINGIKYTVLKKPLNFIFEFSKMAIINDKIIDIA